MPNSEQKSACKHGRRYSNILGGMTEKQYREFRRKVFRKKSKEQQRRQLQGGEAPIYKPR